MEPSNWIGLAALLATVIGALLGGLWLLIRGSIVSAHSRLDRHERVHESVKGEVSTLRERLAMNYVKRDDLRERLTEVLEPVHEDMRVQKRQLDRIERFQLSLMQRLHIPAVLPEEPDS